MPAAFRRCSSVQWPASSCRHASMGLSSRKKATWPIGGHREVWHRGLVMRGPALLQGSMTGARAAMRGLRGDKRAELRTSRDMASSVTLSRRSTWRCRVAACPLRSSRQWRKYTAAAALQGPRDTMMHRRIPQVAGCAVGSNEGRGCDTRTERARGGGMGVEAHVLRKAVRRCCDAGHPCRLSVARPGCAGSRQTCRRHV